MKTEQQTRKEIIDKELLRAGWKVDDSTKVIEEFEIEVGPSSEIEEERYDLSFSRYREDVSEVPEVILEGLLKAELGGDGRDGKHGKLLEEVKDGIVKELLELREMIG